MVTNILIAVLGGGNLLLFVKFLIERHDAKKEKSEANELEPIKKALTKLEKDGLRTQLLLLILLQPDEQTEILTLGERYFRKPPEGLDGNWYMTGIFSKWCNQRKLDPDWFQDKK